WPAGCSRTMRSSKVISKFFGRIAMFAVCTPATAVMLGAAAVLASAALPAHGDDSFYKGKRLNLMINFAVGGPADIEGRLFAKHLAKHIDGASGIIVQNRDCAGGLIGTNYLGEVAPRDGTLAGYLTAAAWHYVIDP